MPKTTSWFAVDKAGMALVLERRGIAYALFELYQNADDTKATRIEMELKPVAGRPHAELRVRDNDPDGFVNLKHAYTLFAESPKKGDPTKGGRYDIGEKLVLCRCIEAQIRSTTGSVTFAEDGERWENPREKTKEGSEFWGLLKLTREEQAEIAQAARSLLVVEGKEVTFNGEPIPARKALCEFWTTLTTEIGGAGEPLRRSQRQTVVRVYEPLPGEPARLYELSVPVVETGDTWDIQVMQRVPLNMERDNVTPGYLRDLRAEVLNAMLKADAARPDEPPRVTPEVAAAAWVTEGAGSPRSADHSVHSVMDLRYGPARVGADPSDRQAEKEAVSQGHVVVQQLALPPELRQRVKESGALAPAGRVFPTPKPFEAEADKMLKLLPEAEWSVGMKRMRDGIERIAEIVFEDPRPPRAADRVHLRIADDPGWKFNGCYRGAPFREITLNAAMLGRDWFDRFVLDPKVLRLVLHELAHEKGHHLDHSYHEALCLYGARLAHAVYAHREVFKNYEPGPDEHVSGHFEPAAEVGGGPWGPWDGSKPNL